MDLKRHTNKALAIIGLAAALVLMEEAAPDFINAPDVILKRCRRADEEIGGRRFIEPRFAKLLERERLLREHMMLQKEKKSGRPRIRKAD